MIYDSLERFLNLEYKKEEFKVITNFLKSFSPAGRENGRFEIPGSEIFGIFLKYDTKPSEEALWEAHRTYIDVQYIYEGEEFIEIADIDAMVFSHGYDSEGDYELFVGKLQHKIKLKKGDVIVLFPNEVHKPAVQVNEKSNEIMKLVFKIPFN